MAKINNRFEELGREIEGTIEYKIASIAFDIAISVHERLVELNFTQKELATRLGVSRSYVSQILKGKTNMTIGSLVKIANVLEMEPDINLKPLVETIPETEFEVINIRKHLDQMTGATGVQKQDMFIISEGNTAATSDLPWTRTV